MHRGRGSGRVAAALAAFVGESGCDVVARFLVEFGQDALVRVAGQG